MTPRRTALAAAAAVMALSLAGGCADAIPPALPRADRVQPAQQRRAPKTSRKALRALTADLNAIFHDSTMAQSLWGVEVKSLDTGKTLFALNPRTLMMPASNMKIVTLAIAAETLGWDYRFKTSLESDGIVDGGTLHGDLVIRGGGDPSINTRGNRAAAVFDEWAAALRAAGITRVEGNVTADARAFDRGWLGAGWAWDYLQYGYAAPVGALEFNEDVALLSVRPGAAPGQPAAIELTAGSGLQVAGAIATGAQGSPAAIDYQRRPGDAILHVSGSIAVDSAPLSREVAVVNPALFFAQGARDALIARGIIVTGTAADLEDAPAPVPAAPRHVLAETMSPTLLEIATVMMKVSQNLYAETLLRTVGYVKSGTGTVEAGHAASKDVLEKWGIEEGSYVQYDGSGLSRYDFVSADMLVTLLTHMFNDPRHHDAFVSTLPIAGKDGTIASRLKKTAAENNATAKTGSIANVRTLSGFVKARNGEMLVFSIVANNFTIPAAAVNAFADRAVARLADYN